MQMRLGQYMPPYISALLAFCGMPLACATAAETHVKLSLNPAWHFQPGEPPGEPYAADHDDTEWDTVSLPHSHQLFAASLAGFAEHGRNTGWYRRELRVPEDWLHRKLFLEFQGAMQTTTLWVNGQKVGEYSVSGYDSFHFDVTPYIKLGGNLIAVRVDNHANRDIPRTAR